MSKQKLSESSSLLQVPIDQARPYREHTGSRAVNKVKLTHDGKNTVVNETWIIKRTRMGLLKL